MAFSLTLLYFSLMLLSPAIFPPAIASLRINLVIGLLAIIAAIPGIARARLGFTLDTYLSIGLTISVAMSILATGWIGGTVQGLALFLPVISGFFLVLIACNSYPKLKIFTAVLTVVALFIFAKGLFALSSGDILSPYLLDEHGLYRFRGLGMVSDPNDLAQLMVTIIPLLWLRWKKGGTFGNVAFTIFPALLLVAGIFCTHSRGGAFALAAVILFGFKEKLGPVKASILVAVALAGIVGLGLGGGRGMAQDDGGRIALWMTALSVFKTHPVFGIGMGNMREFTDSYHTAHNSYVLCMAELGLIGYFFWLGLIVSNWDFLSRLRLIGRKKPSQGVDWTTAPASARFMRATPVAATVLPVPAAGNGSSRLALEQSTLPSRNNPRRIAAVGARPATNFPVGATFDEPQLSDEQLSYAAHVIRTALVGTLVACFFLSRSYSAVLYICLGFGAALRVMAVDRHPEIVAPWTSLLKRTAVITVSSIILLYIFLRVVGAIGVR